MTIHESRRLEVNCQKINLPRDQNSWNIFPWVVQSVPVLETLTKTTKIITQKFDHEGNLLEENITPQKEEVVVNRSMTAGFDEAGDDIQEFLSETYNFPTITKKSVSEVKIVKMVDDLGNVTEQIFCI